MLFDTASLDIHVRRAGWWPFLALRQLKKAKIKNIPVVSLVAVYGESRERLMGFKKTLKGAQNLDRRYVAIQAVSVTSRAHAAKKTECELYVRREARRIAVLLLP